LLRSRRICDLDPTVGKIFFHCGLKMLDSMVGIGNLLQTQRVAPGVCSLLLGGLSSQICAVSAKTE
jgi:hypothetical protein